MIEKKLAIRPARPAMLTKVTSALVPPKASSSARGSTEGAASISSLVNAADPAPPGPKTRTSTANRSSASIPPMSPFGMSVAGRSEEHTSELQSRQYLVCRLLLEKKKEIQV